MAEVKWIKIVTDIFDDEKILLIESCPDADAVIVIWFKLLCLAGKQNNSGVFLMNGRIPYTEEMLATIFRRPVNTVRMALSVFETYGMVEIIDGVITIPKWEYHQNIDTLDKIREDTKKRVQKHREKQKLLQDNVTCNVTEDVTSGVTVTLRNATEEEEAEEEDKIRIEEDKTIATTPATVKKKDVDSVVTAWNTHQLRPAILGIPGPNTEEGAGLKEILLHYPVETVVNAVDQLSKSSFLTGGGERGWKASFKWFCNIENFRKIISGQYDDKKPALKGNYSGHANDEFDPNDIDNVRISKGG